MPWVFYMKGCESVKKDIQIILKRVEQNFLEGENSRAVGTHSSDTVALFLSQTLTLPEPSGEKTCSPPADSLLSGPRECAPEQPTLIFSCQIWDVGCRLEAHRLFSLLWLGP